MILTLQIHPHKTKMQIQDDSDTAIHPHKTKMQIQDNSAAANSSLRNKNANPG